MRGWVSYKKRRAEPVAKADPDCRSVSQGTLSTEAWIVQCGPDEHQERLCKNQNRIHLMSIGYKKRILHKFDTKLGATVIFL